MSGDSKGLENKVVLDYRNCRKLSTFGVQGANGDEP